MAWPAMKSFMQAPRQRWTSAHHLTKLRGAVTQLCDLPYCVRYAAAYRRGRGDSIHAAERVEQRIGRGVAGRRRQQPISRMAAPQTSDDRPERGSRATRVLARVPLWLTHRG